MKVLYYTHRGKVRTKNEDALLVKDRLYADRNFETYKAIQIENYYPSLFCVADGMGGHRKGEVASFLVLDTIRKAKIEKKEDVIKSLQQAKVLLNTYARTHPQYYELGTVLAGIAFFPDEVLVFNIGDCRVYAYRDSDVKRLTKDHSVVEELIDQGFLMEGEERWHPEKHIVTSYIIGNDSASIPKIYTKELPPSFLQNTQLLVCSDGLWESLLDDELRQCFSLTQSELTAECLIRKAFLNGARDNISFILITFP